MSQRNMSTIGTICKRFGAMPHQVKYLVESLAIDPFARVGGLRVFSDKDVERIGVELARIAQAKAAKRRGQQVEGAGA